MGVQETLGSRSKREMLRVGSPLRFVFWNGINTLLGYCVYALLLLALPYLIAYSAAYVFGIVLSFLVNSKLVFNRSLTWGNAAKYPLVYIVQYLLGVVSMYLLVQRIGLNKLIAPAVVVLITIPVTYFLTKAILHGKREHP